MMRISLLVTVVALSFGCVSPEPIAMDPDRPPGDDTDNDDVGAPPPSGDAFVIVHGFGGSADAFAPTIAEALVADGHAVYFADLPSIDGVAVRAAALAPQVDAALADSGLSSVHIIAHSQGGLDSRYVISQMGYADRVASLSTLSTPHRGTPLADAALGLASAGDQSPALDLFAQLAGGALPDQQALTAALIDLSEANADAFNAANPDAVGVLYQSWAGLSTVGGIASADSAAACATQPASEIPSPDVMRAMFVLTAPVVAQLPARQAHDGVVPAASARYANFRGCLSADHIDEVGALDTGNSTLDVADLFRKIAAELASP
jgi:triacylglycerol lipase